jgi:shikimate kinase
MNIVLIGFRCVGKSTVGRKAAVRLRRPFLDTDLLVEERHGMPIREIVHAFGWDGFRQMEKEIVKEISCRDNLVIAAGGGVPVDPENVSALREKGVMVWLKADPQVLRRRLAQDPRTIDQRPPLTRDGTLEELEKVMVCRAAFYEAAMDAHVDTSAADIDTVVAGLLRIVEAHEGRKSVYRIT